MRYRNLFIVTLSFFVPLITLAQSTDATGFVPLTNIPALADAGNAAKLPDFLNSLYKLAIGAAAVLAVLQIIRAGIMYMGGDSVTEKKEAKSLITLSIGGLVLILSPVIVFSIINPKILDLQIGGLDDLVNTEFNSYSKGADIITNTGGGSSVPAECVAYKAVALVSASPGCNTAGGYEKTPDTCCSSTATGKICCGSKNASSTAHPPPTGAPSSCGVYSVTVAASRCTSSGYVSTDNACCSSVGAGQVCCGLPKPTTTTPAPLVWGWRATVVPNNGGSQTTAQLGGLKSQKLCQDSITEYAQKNSVSFNGVFTCNCNTDLSKQPNCSTL